MDIYEVLDQNRGVLGVDDVAEALDLDPEELAAWADDSEVARVDGVLVFTRRDVDRVLDDLADEEDDDTEEDGEGNQDPSLAEEDAEVDDGELADVE